MGTFKNHDWTIPRRCADCGKRPNWWGMRFGIEKHRVQNDTLKIPYLDRYALCIGPIELRLHKFWRGDDDRAPHDHPWWFITMPFTSYLEMIPSPHGADERGGVYWKYTHNLVQKWRFHFRPAGYKHIVVDKPNMKPFWTFVITGRKTREWGFWKTPATFIHNRKWFG